MRPGLPERKPMSTRTVDILLTVVVLAFVVWASGRSPGEPAVLVVGLPLLALGLVVLVRRFRGTSPRR